MEAYKYYLRHCFIVHFLSLKCSFALLRYIMRFSNIYLLLVLGPYFSIFNLMNPIVFIGTHIIETRFMKLPR